MTTVTLPREVVQQALRKLEQTNLTAVAAALRAALDAPAKQPCQMCEHFGFCSSRFDDEPNFKNCTDFDKFQALPPISLTRVTK